MPLQRVITVNKTSWRFLVATICLTPAATSSTHHAITQREGQLTCSGGPDHCLFVSCHCDLAAGDGVLPILCSSAPGESSEEHEHKRAETQLSIGMLAWEKQAKSGSPSYQWFPLWALSDLTAYILIEPGQLCEKLHTTTRTSNTNHSLLSPQRCLIDKRCKSRVSYERKIGGRGMGDTGGMGDRGEGLSVDSDRTFRKEAWLRS